MLDTRPNNVSTVSVTLGQQLSSANILPSMCEMNKGWGKQRRESYLLDCKLLEWTAGLHG